MRKRLIDVVLSREQIVAARQYMLEHSKAVRAARHRKWEMEEESRDAIHRLARADSDLEALIRDEEILLKEAEALGLTASQVWSELLLAELRGQMKGGSDA